MVPFVSGTDTSKISPNRMKNTFWLLVSPWARNSSTSAVNSQVVGLPHDSQRPTTRLPLSCTSKAVGTVQGHAERSNETPGAPFQPLSVRISGRHRSLGLTKRWSPGTGAACFRLVTPIVKSYGAFGGSGHLA